MASTREELALPAGSKRVTFLPFETMTSWALRAREPASLRLSLRLAGTVSAGSIFLASRNLDARVQDVQPLRW